MINYIQVIFNFYFQIIYFIDIVVTLNIEPNITVLCFD
jgi:hypothetical protein